MAFDKQAVRRHRQRRFCGNLLGFSLETAHIEPASYVHRILPSFDHTQVWNLVSGLDNSEMNCLTYAASAEDSSNERTAAKHHHGSVDAESGEPPSCVSDPSWGDTPCQDWSNSRNPNLRNNEEVFAAVFKAVEEVCLSIVIHWGSWLFHNEILSILLIGCCIYCLVANNALRRDRHRTHA